VIKISFKAAVFILLDAPFRAEELTDTAFDASFKLISRTLASPVTGLVRYGITWFCNDAARFQFLPSQFKF
jgi:hypothetical protein